MAGLAAIAGIIIGFIVEIANGRNGSPYLVLGAIAGIAYIVAFFVERWRFPQAVGKDFESEERLSVAIAVVRKALPE